MAQHGYLREFDEGWDRGDDGDRERSRRDDDRERGWRGSGGEWSHRERGWQDDQRDPDERNRNFMLGDRDRSWERGSDQGRDPNFFGESGDRARSRFRDDDGQFRGSHQTDWDRSDRDSSRYGREREHEGFHSGYGSAGQSRRESGNRGDWERSPRNFSSHQDDHYRSWRDRQMNALDSDYQDYCREREQQFHQDFDSWRSNRQSRGSGNQQEGQSGKNEEMELTAENELTHTRAMAGQGSTPSPEGAATLGTNNSENSGVGRGKAQS